MGRGLFLLGAGAVVHALLMARVTRRSGSRPAELTCILVRGPGKGREG